MYSMVYIRGYNTVNSRNKTWMACSDYVYIQLEKALETLKPTQQQTKKESLERNNRNVNGTVKIDYTHADHNQVL